ncbi:hypothetical protein ACTVZO_45370 [Streptomyces sp. IBSNAI002]|uniref:hypothetical protein n=1 Tax=Streptomyces sp. IBSNAI002 TaxID=3457500 RepID=UPI003FD2290A
MRHMRTALAAATALLALTGLASTAHADDHGKDHDKNNVCFIKVEGNHNHNACGSIEYGHNATTGNGHSVVTGLGLIRDSPAGYTPVQINNNVPDLTLTLNSVSSNITGAPVGQSFNQGQSQTLFIPYYLGTGQPSSATYGTWAQNMVITFTNNGSVMTANCTPVVLIGCAPLTQTAVQGTLNINHS